MPAQHWLALSRPPNEKAELSPMVSPDYPRLSDKERRVELIYRRVGIGFVHGAALLAFLPYFFTWTGVACGVAGLFLIALPGINLGYHRLLAHKSVSCSKPLERLFVTLGLLNVQSGPGYWVALHRRHHLMTDRSGDPHSPRGGFMKAHMFFLFPIVDDTDPVRLKPQHAEDVLADPYYAWLEKGQNWFLLPILSWPIFFLLGSLIPYFAGVPAHEAIRIGGSVLIWGVFVRTVIAWHATFSVNSFSHIWGFRSYDTADNSRNNPIVGLLALGEGWHNNHHAFPRSARHGFTWWQFDLTWMLIRGLAALKLLTINDRGPAKASS